MRIAAVAAGVVGAVLTTACGAASVHPGTGARSREPVPWVDRPAPIYIAPQPPLPTYPTGAPWCRASQLRVSEIVGAAMGSIVERFMFHNLSSHTCLLRGFARISAVNSRGRRIELHPEPVHGDVGAGSIIPADIRPGGSGEMLMVGSDMSQDGEQACTMPRYADATFRMLDGGSVGTTQSVWRPCWGWQMTGLGLPQRYPNAPPRPTRGLGALRAAIPMATQVSRGRSLRYVVVLTNPTSSPVALRPCPRYEELLFAKDLVLRHEFWLNCARAHSIPPGGSERFAMVLSLPRPVSLSEMGKLSWVLGIPFGPGAVAGASPVASR